MRAILISLCVLATPGWAHIKLTVPESFQVTDGFGGPQKVAPCGEEGEPTGAVTTVAGGSLLTVTWTETIFHPGHFRISLANDAGAFVTPTPVLDNNGMNCASAPSESTPQWPTLVDGLFEHSSPPRAAYTTQVRVPEVNCERCTLQLMQFMSNHAPPCFYYQCATLRIVLPDSGIEVPDGGVVQQPEPMGCGCSASGDVGVVFVLVLLSALLVGRRSRS